MGNNQGKFYFKDCALSTISTGEKACNLKELHEKVGSIPESSIYHHFWGTRLSHQYETQEYLNDFAMWCYQQLHDQTLAERLSIIDPMGFKNLQELRNALLSIIETRLEEIEILGKCSPFHFARSKIIIFDTPFLISEPSQIVEVLKKISASSIFYHFIDANTRLPLKGEDDFSAWLKGFSGKYENLIQELRSVDFYFFSVKELQGVLSKIFAKYFEEERK